MEFQEMNSTKIAVPKIGNSFVYFLIDGGEVVYVGQTKNGLSRPFSHKDKKYNELAVIECDESELDSREMEFIRKYNPKFNSSFRRIDTYTLKDTRNALRRLWREGAISEPHVRGIFKKAHGDISIIHLKNIMRYFGIPISNVLDRQFVDACSYRELIERSMRGEME